MSWGYILCRAVKLLTASFGKNPVATVTLVQVVEKAGGPPWSTCVGINLTFQKRKQKFSKFK